MINRITGEAHLLLLNVTISAWLISSHSAKVSWVMTTLRMHFGRQIKSLRQATGVSQEAFADRCGFARSYMSRIERGRANPSLDAVEVLAVALGMQVSQLFTFGTTIPAKSKELQVPFAADGSCFNPSLRRVRSGKFTVGGKGHEILVDDFYDAIEHLKSMSKTY